MKTSTVVLSLTMLFSIGAMSSCKKSGCTEVNSCNYDESADINDGTCINKGQVTFWQDSTSDGHDIVVTLNATEANSTSLFNTTPLCDAIGAATFSVCPGSHSYTAHEELPGLKTWSGTITANEDACSTVLLD